MDTGENLSRQTIWNSDCNCLSVGQKLYNINEYYKYKFKILGGELIQKANELGKDCTIEIDIRYENKEETC